MIWLKYLFNHYKKITKISATYSLITKSGNEILEINEEYIPEKEIIEKFGDFDYWAVLNRIEKKKEFVEKFDKRANEILKL